MKLIFGVLLLPFCVAVTQTLTALLQSIQPMSYSSLPLSVWGLFIGFFLWVFLFFCLPRPTRSYVLAHELTHALWGWVMGANIKRLRVSKDGGSVTLTKSNFLVALAPYFFPLYTVLVIAIALVYLVMAIQFESFLHPFTVMFSLPLLTPGAFGLLLLSGQELNIMSYIGIILLVGIVVNNGIILVDFIIQERARGTEKTVAVIKAGPLRLRAILITALSTMIGSLPVALGISEGAELRQPMAIAVVGGLFTSTMLTLFVIPVVYLILDDAKDAMARAYGWIRGTKAAPAAPGVTGGK